MLIDTHAHLDMPEFKHEVASILVRAKAMGVEKIINVGTSADSSKASVDLARRYNEIYAAIGLHPDCAEELNIETRGYLYSLAANKKVVAVGEIGLDYYYLKRSSQY